MIKDNQKVFNRLMVIIDVGITAASFMLAYGFKFYLLDDGPGLGVLPVEEYIKLLPIVLPVYALIYYISGGYGQCAGALRFTVSSRRIPSGSWH